MRTYIPKLITGTQDHYEIQTDSGGTTLIGDHDREFVSIQDYKKLSELLQIMLDPENQPPQFSREEAWDKFQELK